MTNEQLATLLRQEVVKAGSPIKWARKHGLDNRRVNDVLGGRRAMYTDVAEALGYEKRWVKIKSSNNERTCL